MCVQICYKTLHFILEAKKVVTSRYKRKRKQIQYQTCKLTCSDTHLIYYKAKYTLQWMILNYYI